jgi:FAD/FMN-containing dehydrogenase
MLIEDVVCPVENLADMTADLIQLFKDHGYRDASAVGHALEGNLHLVFSQVRVQPNQWLHFQGVGVDSATVACC